MNKSSSTVLTDNDINNNNINNDILQKEGCIIRPPAAGYTVMHCGKLLHGADRVTRGHRTVLVGFVDVADWAICDGVERRACTTVGRMDVAERRAPLQLQQLSMSTQDESSGGSS
ncbi:prolyl 4-hydroxylase alpha-subunit [Fragilaria crotonensis]|nr:prolyl 4-hydroxylase alpha-subunit [Fragilaria crotonensis]